MSETDVMLLPEGLERRVRDRKALTATVKMGTVNVTQSKTSLAIGVVVAQVASARAACGTQPSSSAGHGCT